MGLFSIFNKADRENHLIQYRVGQEWHYHTRENEKGSTLIIVKIEPEEDDFIVHVHVSGVQLATAHTTSGFVEYISHLPLSQEALLASITHLKNDRCAMPDYEFGYVRWKSAYDENKAGVFSIPLNEILNYLEKGIKTE